MQAAGEHIIVMIPPPKTTSEGGIILTTVDQKRQYGRIVSIGAKARDYFGPMANVTHVAFDPQGVIPIDIDATTKSASVAVHVTGVLALLTEHDLIKLGVPPGE